MTGPDRSTRLIDFQPTERAVVMTCHDIIGGAVSLHFRQLRGACVLSVQGSKASRWAWCCMQVLRVLSCFLCAECIVPVRVQEIFWNWSLTNSCPHMLI